MGGCSECDKKATIRANDALAQHFTFARDGFKCRKCDNPNNLKWAHWMEPKNLSIRWIPINQITLCNECFEIFNTKFSESVLSPAQFDNMMAVAIGGPEYESLKKKALIKFKRTMENLESENEILQRGF